MKKVFLLVMILVMVFIMVACDEETVPVPNLDAMRVKNGETTLIQNIDVEGEGFQLECTYDTGDYDLSDWRITDSKTISMTVKAMNLSEDTEIMIEHVHCDINIKSVLAAVDGLSQDSMDDSYHGYQQDGFYIDNDTTYKNIFAIEGYSETLFNGWGYVCGSYGSIEMQQERLTEKNLIVKGRAYAQKMQVVYDIGIKNAGDDKYHVVSVVSEFLIPLNVERYNTEE